MGSEDLKYGKSIRDFDQPQYRFRETSKADNLQQTLNELYKLEESGIKTKAARKHIQSLITNSPQIKQSLGLSKPPSSQTSRA